MKHGDRNRAVGLARIVFYDNGRIEPRKAFERRPEAVFGGEIPACRRAARLPQGRAEARVDEGARAPRCRILLQHSDEHAAVPPERRIGRHPGVKERGTGSHRRPRLEAVGVRKAMRSGTSTATVAHSVLDPFVPESSLQTPSTAGPSLAPSVT